jgi:hypothetical protein
MIGTQYRFADGIEIVRSSMMTEQMEDWSRVRSPSRARRRRLQGHRQRIVYATVPRRDLIWIGGKLIGHPETIDTMLAALPYAGRAV